jgi:hypothetical protein
MSLLKRILASCWPHVRLVFWAGVAAVVAGLAVAIFVGGMAVGYRQACSDFGIYDALAYQGVLDHAARRHQRQNPITSSARD